MNEFMNDVLQQPAALRSALEFYRNGGKGILQSVQEMLTERDGLIFTGMGSSEIAPIAIMGKLIASGLQAELWEAGELLHYHLGACDDLKLVLAVSQSGESFETCGVAKAVRGKCALVAITNDERSFLARSAAISLPLQAGPESTISTKTYSNSLAVLHLLAEALTRGRSDEQTARLEGVAREMEAYLETGRGDVSRAAAHLDGVPFLYFLARGPSLAAARQAALTFSEGARLATCAMPGATFRHGPIELLGHEFAAVVLAPAGRTWDLMLSLALEAAEAGSRIVLLTDSVPTDVHPSIQILSIPDLGEDLFPLNCCLPLELLMAEVAGRKGIEPGSVERIGKITTRE